jgi:hypothetical protein
MPRYAGATVVVHHRVELCMLVKSADDGVLATMGNSLRMSNYTRVVPLPSSSFVDRQVGLGGHPG